MSIKLNDKVFNVRTSDITPYDGSHQTDDAVEFLADSISKFGFQQPVIINSDNVVVAGNGLYKAAVKLGLEEIPCIFVDYLSEEEIAQYRIADNKTSEFASWNEKKLRNELSYLEDPRSLQKYFDEDLGKMLGLNVKMKKNQDEEKVTEKDLSESVSTSKKDEDDVFSKKLKKIANDSLVKSEEYIEYVCSKCGKTVKVKRK